MLKKDYKKILSDVFHECKWLIKYMRKYWWSITLYIFIGIVAILMGLGSSVASKNMIDVVVSHNKAEIVKTPDKAQEDNIVSEIMKNGVNDNLFNML